MPMADLTGLPGEDPTPVSPVSVSISLTGGERCAAGPPPLAGPNITSARKKGPSDHPSVFPLRRPTPGGTSLTVWAPMDRL